jgi:hypothetical protein
MCPGDLVAALLQRVPGGQRGGGGDGEDEAGPGGRDFPGRGVLVLDLPGVALRRLLVAGCLAGHLPGQVPAGPAGQEDAGQPQDGGQDRGGREPAELQGRRQLRAHHRDGEHRDHQPCFQHQAQAGGAVGQRGGAFAAERVHRYQHQGLDRDAAEYVADGDPDVVADRGGHGDRDLRQVRRDRQQDHPAQGRAEVQAVIQHVGGVGQLDARDPDHAGTSGEDQHQVRQRKG